MKFHLYFLFILLKVIPAQSQSQLSIDSLIQPYVRNGFSGVLLVADNSKPIYLKAFGFRDFAQKIPLQSSDIFELASVSKQFTAMIIMMLKEKGKLNYDDPVEKYLNIPYKNITVRNLLTHTGGLPDYEDIMAKHWDKTRVAGNTEIIEYLNLYHPPKSFEPGTGYQYSNTGYVLLASIAEKASGEDFIELARKWIFKPLKMSSTDIRSLQQKAVIKNFALGHIYVQEKQEYIRVDSLPSSVYSIWLGNRKGPGRVSSTASDLFKWDQALYTEKLVKKTILQEAFTPIKLINDSVSNYGFGWMLLSDNVLGKIVRHDGDNPGYKTQIVRYIDAHKTIILLSNNAFDYLNEIIQGIEDLFRRSK